MNVQEKLYYQEVDSEIEKLKNIASNFGKKVRTDSMRAHQLSVFIDLDKYFRAIIYFNFSFRDQFPTAYYLAFQQRRNADGLYGTIYPKRHLVPEQVLNIGEYHSGHYSISKGNSISDAGDAVIQMIINLTPSLLLMCHKSTPWYNEELMNETLREWHTEARLFGIAKEMPIRRMVTGIKAPYQPTYDSCYGLHGSNGTYVENVNPEWVLKFRLRRLDFAVDESVPDQINIHQYITQKLMPRLDWGKITAGRLEQLNNALKNHTIKVVTREMEEAPYYRSFVPTEYASWDDALDSIFSYLQ
jgi:hypothetical protein